MITYLLKTLRKNFVRINQCRLHNYLATSSDLAELERRMRFMEKNGY